MNHLFGHKSVWRIYFTGYLPVGATLWHSLDPLRDIDILILLDIFLLENTFELGDQSIYVPFQLFQVGHLKLYPEDQLGLPYAEVDILTDSLPLPSMFFMVFSLKRRCYTSQDASTIEIGFICIAMVHRRKEFWVVEDEQVRRDTNDRAFGCESITSFNKNSIVAQHTVFLMIFDPFRVDLLGDAYVKLP